MTQEGLKNQLAQSPTIPARLAVIVTIPMLLYRWHRLSRMTSPAQESTER